MVEGLFLVHIPSSSLLRPANLGIIYFRKMRIVKLVGERFWRTSGLELEPQPICGSRHPQNHTVNTDSRGPLGFQGLQPAVLIFPRSLGDAAKATALPWGKTVGGHGADYQSSFLCLRAAEPGEAMSEHLLFHVGNLLPFQQVSLSICLHGCLFWDPTGPRSCQGSGIWSCAYVCRSIIASNGLDPCWDCW